LAGRSQNWTGSFHSRSTARAPEHRFARRGQARNAAALLACLRAEAARHAPDGAAARAAVLPQLLAAAHVAAAALACGEAPFVDVTALPRLLT
jgi:hypothetical protein